jgi:hypothetical protein
MILEVTLVLPVVLQSVPNEDNDMPAEPTAFEAQGLPTLPILKHPTIQMKKKLISVRPLRIL